MSQKLGILFYWKTAVSQLTVRRRVHETGKRMTLMGIPIKDGGF